MDNEATVGNQWVAPSNFYYAKNVPIPKRDVAKAKELLASGAVEDPGTARDFAEQIERAVQDQRLRLFALWCLAGLCFFR